MLGKVTQEKQNMVTEARIGYAEEFKLMLIQIQS